MAKRVLTFDLGASSGRAIVGGFDGERITLEEVHRFDNDPVVLNGTLYWDFPGLFREVKTGIAKAMPGGGFDTLAVDTWGVDFGLVDRYGDLLQNPVHYRDTRTAGLLAPVEQQAGFGSLYRRSGIQIMEINTLYQLCALARQKPALLAQAESALLTPDLFGYFLTGEKSSEYSIASTTQMLDPYTRSWDTELLARLGLPTGLFPPVSGAGRVLGQVRADIREELGLPAGARVIQGCGHDTADAVVAAPARDRDFVYVSCGTWSLFGIEAEGPIIDEKSEACNITNEGGYGDSTLFLRNIIGLWLIQETRRQYRREGQEYSYDALEELALEAKPFAYFIDPDDAAFVPQGNLPRRIREYCRATGQGEPQSVGEVMRCIYESLAMKYRESLLMLRDCTGRACTQIHMLGGGIKSRLLCAMAASATGVPIVAGPVEATAMGSVAVQLMTLGELGDIWQAREVIGKSFAPAAYAPQDAAAWEDAYGRFRDIAARAAR